MDDTTVLSNHLESATGNAQQQVIGPQDGSDAPAQSSTVARNRTRRSAVSAIDKNRVNRRRRSCSWASRQR